MRVNNISNWEYSESLNTMLFFAQRLDELLFHHSTDSYRYPVLSIIGLCDEFIRVYEDVENKIIHEKNIDHILDEILSRLKEDTVAISIISPEFKERIIKESKAWNKREKYDNILYIRRKLGAGKYYKKVIELLKNCISNNNDKRLVDRYSGILVRVLIDAGYSENYIFNCVHNSFFYQKVTGIDSFENFVKEFSFDEKEYDVFIGFSQDFSSLMPLFNRIKAGESDITLMHANSLPMGVKARGQKTILKFHKVKALDIFSAYEMVREISSVIINAFAYYSHIRNKVKVYGQVIDEKKRITSIDDQDLLKYRVSSLSYEESTHNAENMLNITFSTIFNMREISKITEIHNSAIYSENTSDSLLGLWSIAETLSGEEETDKIQKVKNRMIPFLVSTYIEKIVTTCMLDIKRWDNEFFAKNIHNCIDGDNDLESTFAFLAFDEFDAIRKELYGLTEMYPLLRYRVYFLNAQLKNTKGLFSMIISHRNRVEWQLHRIYRARNYIIHDGRRQEKMNRDLVINLHSYIDIMFSKIIDLLSSSPYSHDSIDNVVTEHQLKVTIMDEKVEKMEKVKTTKDNYRQLLYYDYEQ